MSNRSTFSEEYNKIIPGAFNCSKADKPNIELKCIIPDNMAKGSTSYITVNSRRYANNWRGSMSEIPLCLMIGTEVTALLYTYN
ncbi:MAG: hypothetical protein JKY09_02010 [Crocinitomicaceae bacterium]|nr:hypothetical protein [Crocinitomicaceae bacterium]